MKRKDLYILLTYVLIVGIVLILLVSTNPNSADVEKWIKKKESDSNGIIYSHTRSRSYWIFSYHEIIVANNGYLSVQTYLGLLSKLFKV